MVESDVSNEVSATTVLPGPTNLEVVWEIDVGANVTWNNNDDSDDGVIDVERSDDGGSTWNVIASLTVNTEEYTDTTKPDDSSGLYRVKRITDDSESVSDVVEVIGTEFDVTIISTNSPVEAEETLEILTEINNIGGKGTETVELNVAEQ